MSAKSHEFTEKEVENVKYMYSNGYPLRVIANKYNSNHHYIAKLVRMVPYPSDKTILKYRLLSKVKSFRDCWLWEGAMRTDGYGMICVDGKNVTAHKTSFQLFVGKIPSASTQAHVLHLCTNKRCINPNHLYLGTNKDNRYDALLQGAYTDRTTLKAGERDLVKLLWSKNIPISTIAKMFKKGADVIRYALNENDYNFRKFE